MTPFLTLDDERRIDVSGVQLVLGRSPKVDVSFPSRQDLSPEHARIKRVGNRWLLESLSDSVLLVDGAAPAKRHWLKDGDRVLLTDNGPGFSFHASSPETATGEPGRTEVAQSESRVASVSVPTSSGASNRQPEGFSIGKRQTWLVVAGFAIVLTILGFALSNGQSGNDDLAEKPPTPTTSPPDSVERAVPTIREFPIDERLVWVGWEKNGLRFSMCNGWLLDSRTVVTWARGANELQTQFGGTTRVFVQAALGQSRATVSGYRFHPQFNVALPESPTSLQFDVAVLSLDSELVPGLSRLAATIQEPRQLRPNVRVELATCQLPPGPNLPAIDETNTPRVAYSQVSILEVVAVPNTSTPVLRLGILAAEGMEGTAVIDASGRIIATVTRADENEVLAVPIDRLEALIGRQ